MKRKVLVLLAAFLLAGTPLFAADGDLIVNGKVGIGTTAPRTEGAGGRGFFWAW